MPKNKAYANNDSRCAINKWQNFYFYASKVTCGATDFTQSMRYLGIKLMTLTLVLLPAELLKNRKLFFF